MRRWSVVSGQVDSQRGDALGITDRLLEIGEPGGVAAGAQHRHALLGKHCRAAESDAATGACDDCYLHLSLLL